MMNVSVDVTYGESRPLEELSRLMAMRCKVLHETAQDAAVATVINALNSLRAQTRAARPAAKTRPKIVMRSELNPSIAAKRGGGRRRTLRNELGHRVKVSMRKVWLSKGFRMRELHTYLVTPEHERDRKYLVIAPNSKMVANYENRRSRRRKVALGGLAKYTLGFAMARLSTRNGPGDAGMKAQAIAPQFAHAATALHGHELTVEVHDALDYALLALKGGRGSIDLALKRAANKTFGLLSHECAKWGKVEDIGPCPFPELAGKGRGK